MSRDRMRLVGQEEIRAALRAIEDEVSAGRMSDQEAARRMDRCRRAVTTRDLWKASGGRAGDRHRSNWADLRGTIVGLTALLLMIVLGVWLVTRLLAQAPTG